MTDNELLDRYISGAITAPQEAELERRALSDPVLTAALSGLSAFPEEDHAGRVAAMMKGARPQVRGAVKEARVRSLGRYGAAAAVALLVVAAIFLLPRFTGNGAGELAMESREPSPEATEKGMPSTTVETAPRMKPDAEANNDADVELLPAPAPEPPAVRAEADAPAPVAAPAPPVTAAPATAPEPESFADELIFEEEVVPDPVVIAPVSRESVDAELKDSASRKKESRRELEDLPRRQVDAVAAASAGVAAGASNGKMQRTTITGRITDENGRPITDVLVSLPGQPIGERTDTSGVFVFTADATTSLLEFSHPDYASESFAVDPRRDDIQLTLERLEEKKDDWKDVWSVTTITMDDDLPGQALPAEGYSALRRRIEAGKPGNVPSGRVKFSFVVKPNGILEDFIFRGEPSQETMDYVGETIMKTSVWEVVRGDEAVRVYFKVVFE